MSIGGTPALEQDSIHSLFAKLPMMVTVLIITTTILMFLAFGSVVLPIKAAVMSALTLGSTMGVLTWMFVDGHGSGLMNYTPQPLMAPMIGMIIAIIWGLSTDYEVFLVSRMVEARERGLSTAEAIRVGTATTGRLITGAALILAVVAGAFAFSDLVMMKYLAFGLLIALLLDATVIRMFLVPAIMKLLGDDCWWAPKWMKRLQERLGLGETELPDERKRPAVREEDALVAAGAPLPPRPLATTRPEPSGRRGLVTARRRDDADPDRARPHERTVRYGHHPHADTASDAAGGRAADHPDTGRQQPQAPQRGEQRERGAPAHQARDTAATRSGGPRDRVVAGRIARERPRRGAAARTEAPPAEGRRAHHRHPGAEPARRPTSPSGRGADDRDSRARAAGSGSDREADRTAGRGRGQASRWRRRRQRR